MRWPTELKLHVSADALLSRVWAEFMAAMFAIALSLRGYEDLAARMIAGPTRTQPARPAALL